METVKPVRTVNNNTVGYNKYSVSNLTDIEIDGVDLKDYPDFSDASIVSAVFKDTGVELTEKELDILNEKSDIKYELVYNWLF